MDSKRERNQCLSLKKLVYLCTIKRHGIDWYRNRWRHRNTIIFFEQVIFEVFLKHPATGH